MINKKLSRAIAATAGVGLAFASLVGIAAPAQAAAPSTTFKIHLNVSKAVAEQWNLWYWNTGVAGVEPVNNTLGETTKTIAGSPVTMDWTPNFSHEDAYGVYAEFTLPATLKALNNVMRTTESWDGQDAADAVVDNPATPDVDETAAAKPAIAESDKPFGGDNIFPAGESWWNVGTGLREYPLKAGNQTIKVHVNAPLATLQAQGFSLWAWNSRVEPMQILSTFKVGKKTPYKGLVPADLKGVPFSGSDKYGAFATITVPKAYVADTGFIFKRSTPSNGWAKQSVDYMMPAGTTNAYVNIGTNTPVEGWKGNFEVTYNQAPSFIGRWGATATWSNGVMTITPVRPAAASLRGAAPDTIVVTVKKGAGDNTTGFSNNKCTISASVLVPNIDDFQWAMPESCTVNVAAGPEAATYSVFVQASASGIGSGLASVKGFIKVVVPAA